MTAPSPSCQPRSALVLALPARAAGQRLDHAAQQVHVGLVQVGALHDHLQRAHHALAPIGGAKEVRRIELAHQVLDQLIELALGGAARWRAGLPQRCRGAGLEPLVADQQHRLGQVERAEVGIERHAQHGVGEDQVVVGKAGALRPEQHADPAALAQRGARLARGSRPRSPPAWADRAAAPWSRTAPPGRRPPPRPARRSAARSGSRWRPRPPAAP